MSLLAALIVVAGFLTAVLTGVAAVARWSDQRPIGRAPHIVLTACAIMVVVQLPLADGPSWRNVPMAFAIVAGSFN